MGKALSLFLIAPKGYEEMATVIVAPSEEIARDKMNNKPQIRELTDIGIPLISVNVTNGLAIQGYNVDVSKTGMFH